MGLDRECARRRAVLAHGGTVADVDHSLPAHTVGCGHISRIDACLGYEHRSRRQSKVGGGKSQCPPEFLAVYDLAAQAVGRAEQLGGLLGTSFDEVTSYGRRADRRERSAIFRCGDDLYAYFAPYGAILFHAVDEVVAQAVVEADYKGLDGKFLAQYRQKVFRAHASERFVETQQYDILRAGL